MKKSGFNNAENGRFPHNIKSTTLGRLGSGEPVVDRHNSHLHSTPMTINGQQKTLAEFLPQLLCQVHSHNRSYLIEQIDFEAPIGLTVCVETGPDDEIIYAKRPKRFGHTRFAKHRTPEPCSSLVLILKPADGEAGKYVLITAFVGTKPEPEPWDRNATAQSRVFWDSHALVWNPQEIIAGTILRECPWR